MPVASRLPHCAQDLRLADVRARISSPAFARAAHAVLQTHAAAVPSLPRPSPRAVGAALSDLAPRLRFVAVCRARTVLREGSADVTRAGARSQVLLHCSAHFYVPDWFRQTRSKEMTVFF